MEKIKHNKKIEGNFRHEQSTFRLGNILSLSPSNIFPDQQSYLDNPCKRGEMAYSLVEKALSYKEVPSITVVHSYTSMGTIRKALQKIQQTYRRKE